MNRQEFLYLLKDKLQPSPICLEIGCYEGSFSQMIWNTLKPQGLFLIDTFETVDEQVYHDGLPTSYSTDLQYKIVKEKFSEQITKGTVTISKGTSDDLHPYFPENFFDFIYLDACHLQKCVENDLNNYFPKLNKNGILGGHDYNSVFEGVRRAVDIFCLENGYILDLLSDEGDFTLKKK